MSRLLALCFAGFLSFVAPAAVLGASVTGSDAPEFQSALQTWLDGEDLAALQSLASLARAENRAAQVFLGQVASKPWLHAHVTDALDRKDRIELLRNPVGLSGTSWLASAAADTPLAQDFLDANQPYRDPENAKALFAQGELDAALPLLARAQTAGDVVGALELALSDPAAPYSSGFVLSVAREFPVLVRSGLLPLGDPRMPEIYSRIAQLPKSDPGGELMWGNGEGLVHPHLVAFSQAELKAMGTTLMEVAELQPILRIVQKRCPVEAPEALAALQMASYGQPLTLLTFSPVETILPSATYRESARFEADMLRRLDFSASEVVARNLNACAYAMISRSGL